MAEDVKVTWIGTRYGIEARTVPADGIEFDEITIHGLRGKGLVGWLLLPIRLGLAVIQSLYIIHKREPGVVLAMGGFVSGPGAIAAWLLRKPLVVHEQNAIPGLTNRILALIADRVLCGFPDAFGEAIAAKHVGNPVREDIVSIERPATRLSRQDDTLRILVVGGSQGAAVFNRIMPQVFQTLQNHLLLDVWHQCGVKQEQTSRASYADLKVHSRVTAFIEDISEAYSWADLIVCRAGAMTVSEISVVGLAAILVPYLHAVDDHQSVNARFLSERGAAILINESEFTVNHVAVLILEFSENRDKLAEMAQAALACAMPDATKAVVDCCRELAHA